MSLTIRYFVHWLALAVAVLAAPALTVAQGGSIRGNVVLPNGANLNERAKVTLQTDRGIRTSVYTDDRGRFQFTGLTPNIYEIVVEPDGDRFEVARATVEIFPGSPAILNINLREKKVQDTEVRVKTVSTGEIDSSVPAQAKKEFSRATDAGKAGRTDEAIQHLRKAIALYPQYLMAHNDLGTYLLAQRKLSEAEDEFRLANKIDPKAFNPCLNLGIVLVERHEFSEALQVLTVALSQEPQSPAATLYRGLAFEGLNNFESAEKDLLAAHDLGGAAYAIALFHLGQIYMNTGQRARARQMFESYLREAPTTPEAVQARKMVDILR